MLVCEVLRLILLFSHHGLGGVPNYPPIYQRSVVVSSGLVGRTRNRVVAMNIPSSCVLVIPGVEVLMRVID